MNDETVSGYVRPKIIHVRTRLGMGDETVCFVMNGEIALHDKAGFVMNGETALHNQTGFVMSGELHCTAKLSASLRAANCTARRNCLLRYERRIALHGKTACFVMNGDIALYGKTVLRGER